MFKQIDDAVSKYVSMSDKDSDYFHSLLKKKTIRKKTYLLQEGDVCHFEGFVIDGCVRTFYRDKEGLETIITFATEGWWVSDLCSFMDQKPSNMFIEALEDTELFMIDYQSKMLLFEKVPQLEKFFRIIVQRSLCVIQQRFYASISQTAEERYLAFTEKYPHLLNRVPLHLIARYIGVSPEFLSKVRHNISKGPSLKGN